MRFDDADARPGQLRVIFLHFPGLIGLMYDWRFRSMGGVVGDKKVKDVDVGGRSRNGNRLGRGGRWSWLVRSRQFRFNDGDGLNGRILAFRRVFDVGFARLLAARENLCWSSFCLFVRFLLVEAPLVFLIFRDAGLICFWVSRYSQSKGSGSALQEQRTDAAKEMVLQYDSCTRFAESGSCSQGKRKRRVDICLDAGQAFSWSRHRRRPT